MRRFLVTIIVFFSSIACFATMPIIDPELAVKMKRMDNNERIKVNILLSEQSNAMALLREAEFYFNKQEQRRHRGLGNNSFRKSCSKTAIPKNVVLLKHPKH